MQKKKSVKRINGGLLSSGTSLQWSFWELQHFILVGLLSFQGQ